jgi:Flp pilus assembly protein TadG
MTNRLRCRNERGSVAVEFALIVPVFLLLIYGGLSFGLAMSARGVLTEAAAEGARAAIGAQVIPADAGSQCTAFQRVAAAQAQSALKALGTAAAAYATITATATPCQAAATTGVLMTVTITYPYGAHPTIPNAPGLGAVMPATLGASYSVGAS